LVPHHLVDLCGPHEPFSVAHYLAAANEAACDVIARGRVPLFVGGTGLYLRALLRGVFDGPQILPEIRQHLEAELASNSLELLYEELAAVDPSAAKRIHPNDAKRVLRALEVYRATGRTLSELQRQKPLPVERRPANVFWLSAPRPWLYDRIDRRVEQMFTEGLLGEVRGLLDRSVRLSHTARQALGYKEVIAHFEQGMPLTETITLIQTRTRQFAKRQHTWFRHLEECRPIEMSGGETAAELAQSIQNFAGTTIA
jgi:tRNA dimethylallyltransferase